MPLYDFLCPKCGAEYELFKRNFSEAECFCECGEEMDLKPPLIANTPDGWGRP